MRKRERLAGSKAYRLRFEAEKPKPPSMLRHTESAADALSDVLADAVLPVDETEEEENVGVQVARTGRQGAESSVRRMSKQRQKKQIQRQYAAAQTGRQAEGIVVQGAGEAVFTPVQRTERKIEGFIRKNRGKLVILLLAVMMTYIHVSITDHAGNVQAKSEAISCFDSTPPTVKAGVSGEVICIEATDSISGVAAVYVNGHKLKYSGTTLDANIREYADGRQQIAIYAVDLAGNVSQKVYVKNPFYGRNDSGSSGNDSKPSATKKPSSGGAKTTPKPTATPIPTDVPQATMQPQTTAAPDIDAIYALLVQLAGGAETGEPTEGKPFSMGGNMKTVDLLYSKATNKQFITVQTRKGETYYLVIDYDKPLDKDGEQYETYFLNLVDDRDLFGVVSKDEQPTPEPTATPTPKPTAEPKPETEKTTDSTAMMALVLLVVLIAGGAAAFVVLGKKRDAQPRYNTELDDDDDEEEIGEDNEEK